MNNIVVELSTSNMVIFHSLQRMVYQYHSMFSSRGVDNYNSELIDAWYKRIFDDNDNFKFDGGQRLSKYELRERKLIITIIQPFYHRDFIIDLDKPINSCVTIIGEEGSLSDVNIFSIQYKLDANDKSE